MHRGHGNIQGMRGVRKQLQQEEQKIREPSRKALNNSTVSDTAVIDTTTCYIEMHYYCLYELLVAFVVLVPDTHSIKR